MNYILAAVFATVGVVILICNKSLAEKLGAFYARRFNATFGKPARILGLDNPNIPFNRFMYRGFVLTAGIILLIFAVAAFFGANFVGPPTQPANSFLQSGELSGGHVLLLSRQFSSVYFLDHYVRLRPPDEHGEPFMPQTPLDIALAVA
jgi:hypothetical protein